MEIEMGKIEEKATSFADKWSPAIASHGHTSMPNLLINNLDLLNITSAELATLAAILTFKWDSRDPYPSINTLALLVCRTDRTVRRHLESLESKKLIKRVARPNQPSEYDISALIGKLNMLAKNVLPGQKRPLTADGNVHEERSDLTAKEDTVNEDTNKNSILAPNSSVMRGQEVSDVIAYWVHKTDLPIDTNITANQKAAAALLVRFGGDKVKQLIDGSAEALTDKYAPTIGDLCQLNSKANQLIAWGRKRQGGVRII
jgi:hypothetical protein